MNNPKHTLRPARGAEKGVSLILTLSLIVLVTFASVAFFTRTASNSSIENERVGQIYTQQISESGVDHVLSLLLSEIRDNSVTVTNGASLNFLPSSNAAGALAITGSGVDAEQCELRQFSPSEC